MTPETPPPGDAVDALFRQEAIDEYLRGRTRGHLLQVSSAWKGWAFVLLAATFLGALAFAALVQLHTYVSGTAVVRRVPEEGGGTPSALEVVVLFPGDAGPHVRVGTSLRLQLEGSAAPTMELPIREVTSEIYGIERSRQFLGPAVADIPQIAGPSLIARCPWPVDGPAGASPPPPGTLGVAEIRTGSQSILQNLLFRRAS